MIDNKKQLEHVLDVVRRMGQLEDYPKFLPVAEAELARTAITYAKDLKHLERVITQVIEEDQICPRPMALRNLLARPEESDIPRGCSRCNGSPWVTVALPNGISAASRCDCPRGIWYRQKDRKQDQVVAKIIERSKV